MPLIVFIFQPSRLRITGRYCSWISANSTSVIQ